MPRILIVDDEAMIRYLLRMMLAKGGYEDVEEAANGREAQQQAQAQPPDLLITDMFMPGSNGLETIQALRRYDPGLLIIAMSGGGPHYAGRDVLRVAQDFGAAAILRKPFGLQEVLAVVQALLPPPEAGAP